MTAQEDSSVAAMDAEESKRLWQDARRSIATGIVLLVCCAAGLAAFVMSMPKLQVRVHLYDRERS